MNKISHRTISIGSTINQRISLPIINIGKGKRKVGIVGGVHGNEPESLFIIRELFNKLRLKQLNTSVKILPGANPLALANNTRQTPIDAMDLNRSFPGNPEGTITQKIAAAMLEEFSDCDLVVDIHSIVNHGYYMGLELQEDGPLLEKTRDMNRLLNPPFIWKAIEGNKFHTSFAHSLIAKGVCGMVIEVPRLEFLNRENMDRIVDGLMRLINPPRKIAPLRKSVPVIADEKRYLSENGGIYTPVLRPMTAVLKGDVVGIFTDLITLEDRPLRSKWSGVLSVQSTRKVVCTGDKIYVVGEKVSEFR